MGDKCQLLVCPNNCTVKTEEEKRYDYDLDYKLELNEISVGEFDDLKEK